jgi:hypothetical protein
MQSLQAIARKLRRYGYRLRYRRDFSDALIAYESVFQEVLSDLYPGPDVRQCLKIDFGWTCDLDSYDAAALPGGWVRDRQVRLSVRWFSDFQGITNAIFRSRDMFMDVGDPSKGEFTFAQLLEDAGGDSDRDSAADPLRQEASCITVEMALAMIVLHEIGHHALGHMELGEPRRFKFREAESTVDAISPECVLLRQACEIDADHFSFSHALEHAATGRSPFSTQLVSPRLKDHLFSLAILAHSLVIALLHTQDNSFEAYELSQHPHPAIRLLASQLHFAELLARHGESANAYSDGWRESLRVVQQNADQKETLLLLANRRTFLEERVGRLSEVVDQQLRKATKRYDFSSGEWIKS